MADAAARLRRNRAPESVPGMPEASASAEYAAAQVRGLRTFCMVVASILLLASTAQMIGMLLYPVPGPSFFFDESTPSREIAREGLEMVAQVLMAFAVWRGVADPAANQRRRLGLGTVLYLAMAMLSAWYDAGYLLVNPNIVNPSWQCVLVLVYALLVPAPARYHYALVGGVALILPAMSMGWLQAGAYGSIEASAFLGTVLAASTPIWVCGVIAAAVARENERRQARLEHMEARLERLGSYALVRRLGSGAMGEVWLGRHELLARPAAIKVISPRFLQRASASERALQVAMARFEREAKATASLTSPHTVQVWDFGTTPDGDFYYVMELLDGVDLDTLVDVQGPLPPGRVAWILAQACDSLAEAHDAGLIHRDIKPANVFLCRKGVQHDFVKVLDFGLVLDTLGDATGADQRLTADGNVNGTPAYMAPEQARGMPIDARIDLYALGCVAYWLLTGRDVFAGRTAMEVLLKHVNEAPVPPSDRMAPGTSDPELEAIVLQCLAKEPEDRPRNAHEVLDRIRAMRVYAEWDARRSAEQHRRVSGERRTTETVLPGEGLPSPDAGDEVRSTPQPKVRLPRT